MRRVTTVTSPRCCNRFWTDNKSLASNVVPLASGRTWTVSMEGWYEHFSTWHNLAAFSADSALGRGIDKAQSDSFSLVSVGGVTQTQSAPTPGYVLSQVSFSSDLSSVWKLHFIERWPLSLILIIKQPLKNKFRMHTSKIEEGALTLSITILLQKLYSSSLSFCHAWSI